ncbi:uncharacterized protein PGTG_22093 [Puccinia graminis f. sp. tritici CRL 75-36-700-3]|uniref:Uncharacterized protein n=1 Tax=Puccinia graminis f. sp. tritici (strain CRL 75-36-700-3 / race SCCL) TaxID=418459 RepID=H6QTG9_PUCGT|nr:uncharacterized protein PGTG_22093 [Puccinia graminis f. sp. tritici CRL 75-36-700-3]EHS64184.1 hypothetical protein PGTG_22093 [Puccinia graminis f. sp. tritici CRL 75-36-700-3]
MEGTCEIIPLSGNCQRCQEYRVRCSFQSRTTLIETLYQNIMELRTRLALREWAVKEREEEYNKLSEEYEKIKKNYAELFDIAYKNSPSEQAEQPEQ